MPGLEGVSALAIRAAVIYFYVLIVTRLLGKREIGQVSPFDFVVAIMIGELAVVVVENTDRPLLDAMVPIATMAIIHIGISLLSLKSVFARRLLSGSPTIVIERGRIVEKGLRGLRICLDDLLAALREKNVTSLDEVEYAILENTGKLSVILKSAKRPVRCEDLGVTTEYEGLPYILVVDGRVDRRAMAEAGVTEEWLREELRKRGIERIEDAFVVSLTPKGALYVSPRSGEGPHRTTI